MIFPPILTWPTGTLLRPWDDVTSDRLMAITFENANVIFDDGVNTDSMRNLGGGGVLAATFGQVAGLSLAHARRRNPLFVVHSEF